MRALLAAALVTLAVATTIPANAKEEEPDIPAELDVRGFVCPVGGEAFKQEVGYFSLPLYILPDGSWLGDFQINTQIPVCPENGLVLLPDLGPESADGQLTYESYSDAERLQLPALIADPEYRALGADGAYSQAAWLAEQLHRSPALQLFLLQRATWGTISPEARRRTLERFAKAAPTQIELLRNTGSDGSRRAALWQTYLANAFRELGQMDEANELIDLIEAELPELELVVDQSSLFGGRRFAEPLRAAVAARDTDRFPVNLLPEPLQRDVCNGEPLPPEQKVSENALRWCAMQRKELAD